MKQLFRRLFSSAGLLLASSAVTAAETLVFFGTHSKGAGKGFSVAGFDSATGALSAPQYVVDAEAPAFFVIHPDGRHLYTCNSGLPGAISAYQITPGTAQLTLLNKVPSGGGDPSYLSLDRTGRYVLVANYQGGNIAVFALLPDGRIGERTAFVQHTGSSVNPQRQSKPYAHAIRLDPANRFALVPDLGVDRVFVYRFDEKTGTLTPNDPPSAKLAPGSGPRHVVFHQNGTCVYVVNEIASTVTGFNWEAQRGVLTEIQTLSTLPPDYKGANACAEIEIHPNGKFLYVSNRGHDSIALFSIDAATGQLTLVETVPSGGKTPRNFTFDPSGKWLLVTNHGSNNAVVFKADAETGHLTPVGEPVTIPSPFCERFLAVR